MPNVKLTREARTDLKNIDNYTYQQWGRAQADKYIEMIETRCLLLANHPSIGKPQDELSPGLRRYPIGKHYIFYRTMHEGIEIIRVLHQAMDASRHIKQK